VYCFVGSEVFKARCKKTKKLVALKKVLMENEKEGVSTSLVQCTLFSMFVEPGMCTRFSEPRPRQDVAASKTLAETLKLPRILGVLGASTPR